MTLLELLVQELPKRGGWPAGASICERFLDESNIDFYDEKGNWPEDCGIKYGFSFAEKLVQPRLYGKGPCTEVVKKQEYEAALTASKRSEWDGEHLPPVGTHCEYLSEKNGWVICEILLYRKSIVVMETDLNGAGITINRVDECQFRPIRTEAERKREDIIKQMSHSLRANGSITNEQLDRLYDDIANGNIFGIELDD